MNKLDPLHSHKKDEWYTPARVVDLARQVMGGIDLDPASSTAANETIKARTIYTKQDDGLSQPWSGRIWLNPPYSSAGGWIARLVEAYEAGQVNEAIVLVAARTDTRWFQLLHDYPVCFWKGRTSFIGGDDSAPFPSVIVYLGQHQQTFFKVFAAYGGIRPPALQRTAVASQLSLALAYL